MTAPRAELRGSWVAVQGAFYYFVGPWLQVMVPSCWEGQWLFPCCKEHLRPREMCGKGGFQQRIGEPAAS